MVSVLSEEGRLDNFVTAETRKERIINPLSALFGRSEEDRIVYDLRLNCSVDRCQLDIKLTPKFNSLRQITLVVSCAPSLDTCYIFATGVQNRLEDFGKYETRGYQILRHCYRIRWTESVDEIATSISSKLGEIVREQLELTAQRLSDK